jgi:ADP-ribose pyrophosphatase
VADDPLPWQVLGARTLHKDAWREVVTERVRLHGGQERAYTYVKTPAAVWVVPLTADFRIVLLRQYRHPVRAWCWEVPAGTIGAEGVRASAARELSEEVGGAFSELLEIGAFYSSSAHLTLKAHVFLATGVTLGPTCHEETELIEIVTLPANEAFARARAGEINEGQSALALLLAEPHIRRRLADQTVSH